MIHQHGLSGQSYCCIFHFTVTVYHLFIFDTTTAQVCHMSANKSQTHKGELYSDLTREHNLELLHWESARGDFVNVEYVFSSCADKQDSFCFWTTIMNNFESSLKAFQTPTNSPRKFKSLFPREVIIIYEVKKSFYFYCNSLEVNMAK